MLCLHQSTLEAYIRDPVLAAWAIFGMELDVFQAVRLRMMWWIPELIDDSGIIEAIHRIAQGLFASGSILWPTPTDDLLPHHLAALDPEQAAALRVLSTALSQFLTIKVVVGSDLSPRLTKRGFLMFRAEGKRKKDLAYAALYSLTALLSLLMDPDFHDDDPDPNLCMASG